VNELANLHDFDVSIIGCKDEEIPHSTWACIGFHFATRCSADQRTMKCCNQMRFASIQCSKMWLRRTPLGELTVLPQAP